MKKLEQDLLTTDSGNPWLPESIPREDDNNKLDAQSQIIPEESQLNRTSNMDEIVAVPNVHIIEPDEEAEKWEKVNERKQRYLLPPRPIFKF
jgi:hypothetical protein